MKTTHCTWRKQLIRTLDPQQLIKFPEEMKIKCATCTDVRIGCTICKRCETSICDIALNDNYFNEWIKLCDIDFRGQYHHGKTMDTVKEVTSKVWYICNKIPRELLYELRKMEKYLVDNNLGNGIKKFTLYSSDLDNQYKCSSIYTNAGGVSIKLDDDVTELVDYYGPGTGKITDDENCDNSIDDSSVNNESLYEWKMNHTYIGEEDELILCVSCYKWFVYVHQNKYDDNFEEMNGIMLSYLQWLDDHEDKLILKKED